MKRSVARGERDGCGVEEGACCRIGETVPVGGARQIGQPRAGHALRDVVSAAMPTRFRLVFAPLADATGGVIRVGGGRSSVQPETLGQRRNVADRTK